MSDRDTIWSSGPEWSTGSEESIPRKYLFFAAVAILVAATLGGGGVYLYLKSQSPAADSQMVLDEDSQKVLKKVGELIVLPDEQPTIATVADPQRLKDQPFFAKAQKGYKVLIFTNAKKAILYDPVNHKIVEVAPLNIGETAGVTTPTPSPAP